MTYISTYAKIKNIIISANLNKINNNQKDNKTVPAPDQGSRHKNGDGSALPSVLHDFNHMAPHGPLPPCAL